jgi:hypothetical protein
VREVVLSTLDLPCACSVPHFPSIPPNTGSIAKRKLTRKERAAYAEYAGDQPHRISHDYRQTLAEEPWKNCPCLICQNIGIEVVIFRGNNRNRRRGFHNIWQLYWQLHAPITTVEPNVPIVQLELRF